MYLKYYLISILAAFKLLAKLDHTNIILIMTDDQGWGQMGYMNHPVLKTPNLDKMAANGLRFDRFYAGGPVCSPTRATVLTGRTHDRTGVFDHGYALRLQEKTLSQALKHQGYATGHFGKWHLNGLRGPGVPVLKSYPNGPSAFGFDQWISVTNFFDLNPIMSRNGKFEEMEGDSSEIIVEEALSFIRKSTREGTPFFCAIWFGTPHSPFMALERDLSDFKGLTKESMMHHAELKAMDRSIGSLRKSLRSMKIQNDTLVWFMSDNGGLPKIVPRTTGGLRDYKGSLYEGGIRVPAIIEWPSKLKHSRISFYPAGAVDIFPTIAEITGLPAGASIKPQDGQSLVPIFGKNKKNRTKPLIFSSRDRMAMIDNQWKLLSLPSGNDTVYELYDLSKDSAEKINVINDFPLIYQRLQKYLTTSKLSISKSKEGKDYLKKMVDKQPPRIFWTDVPAYKKYFKQWEIRPEYRSRLNKK